MVLLHEEDEEEPNHVEHKSNNKAQRPHTRQNPKKAYLTGEFVVEL